MIARWNKKDYKILNSIEINKSSREVTYTDLTLDFAKCTIDDLPYAQQEIKIYDKNNNLKFTGFLANYSLPELRLADKIKRELTMSLFTPRQMTTKRTVTVIRTAKLSEVLGQVLNVLYEDGFTLLEFNVPDVTITVKLISRTIEEVLNYLSNKYSLYWNIDELKQITINSIEYQFNKPVVKNININNYKDIKGFIKITPSVENSDYANIINVKNARIFYNQYKTGLNITLKNGDRIDFDNPIDISYETAQRIAGSTALQGSTTVVMNLYVAYNDSQIATILSTFNDTQGNGINFNNIATDDTTGAMFVLTMDSMFKNLATGITYKGEGTVTIREITSETNLRYANMKLINWYEINENAGKITQSGQIEKVLDVQNGWFTIKELIEYVRNLFTVNNKYTNQVNLYCDKDNGFLIGDRLEINLPEIFVKGNFIITDINEAKEKNNPTQYTIKMRNTNLLENYIDLFRNSSDIEEQQSQVELEYVVEYAEEESVEEVHEVQFSDNTNNHTLNFTIS